MHGGNGPGRERSNGHAERVQAEVWLGGTEYGHLSAEWRNLLR